MNVRLSNNIINQLQLENLIQQTTCLYSLTLSECLFSYEFLFNLKSLPILRLYLYDFGCFDEEQCNNLTRSPLGIQCEVLFIIVKDRTNILNRINEMKNLRALNVRCQADKWKRKHNELLSENELIEWLKDFLPKTCIIMRGNSNDVSCIQLWIR